MQNINVHLLSSLASQLPEESVKFLSNASISLHNDINKFLKIHYFGKTE
jgi:hypothetical protein